MDYAFGGATTRDGQTERTIINNPFPFSGGNFTITIDNIGKQVADYLGSNTPDPNVLYLLWGGGNDLFDDSSATNVTATANRVRTLVDRLALAGARKFFVPNVPPLGAVPNSLGHPSTVAALDLASALQSEGFLVPAIRYPTVAKGTARLRITVTASHKENQIRSLCQAIRKMTKLE